MFYYISSCLCMLVSPSFCLFVNLFRSCLGHPSVAIYLRLQSKCIDMNDTIPNHVAYNTQVLSSKVKVVLQFWGPLHGAHVKTFIFGTACV